MHTAERVTLARLPSGIEVTTTIHTYDGAGDGPTIYLQAAQHGREVNGTEVLRQVHDTLADADLAGRIVAVPVANPLTFDRVSYTTPEQLDSVHSNMNRVWPGDPDGSLHERMAAHLWEFASEADAVVDLHTGSPDMLTHVVYRDDDEESRELAEAFGTDCLLAEPAGDDASEEWKQRNFAGKFRVAAAEEGIPAVTPELAHNKQIVEEAVETGVTGVLNVLRYLGALDGTPKHADDPTVARDHLGRVDAEESGLFRPHPDRHLGERVAAGTPLGTVYDPTTYEVLQEATADNDGVLYAVTREATVVSGDKLANVAILRE